MFMAKIAYEIQRYEDCLEYLTPLLKNPCVDIKTIKMWSNCNKQIINKKRSAWSKVITLENNLDMNCYNIPTHNKIKLSILSDFKCTCNKVIRFIDDHLMNSVSDIKHKIILYHICGDYHRYKAEVGDTMLVNYHEALNKYNSGWKLCLENTVDIRTLLYFAFKYAICLNSFYGPDKAVQLIEEALCITNERYSGGDENVNIPLDLLIKYKQALKNPG